ncbi:UNVERIFIED_CONTAM: hypothetical protein Slati_0503700 [Sesamum latifolium]|uniref:Endonuclease/exonuclease/phosphatase domain-containing protein n=1 Tax=Sesamum latifolium TaxID=2727402 RepID=A0AAW2XYL6_9LAMI
MLLWRKDISLVVHSFSTSHIDATVSTEEGTYGWRFTGIYGQPDAAKRSESWKLLRSLSKSSSRPWICACDFNEILSPDEKIGIPRPRRQIEEFRSRLSNCSRIDHTSLIIKLAAELSQTSIRRKRLFQFEGMWIRAPDCENLVHCLWNHEVEGTASERILQRQWAVREGFIQWDRTTFGQVHSRVKELEDKLSKVTTDPISVENRLMRSWLRKELDES